MSVPKLRACKRKNVNTVVSGYGSLADAASPSIRVQPGGGRTQNFPNDRPNPPTIEKLAIASALSGYRLSPWAMYSLLNWLEDHSRRDHALDSVRRDPPGGLRLMTVFSRLLSRLDYVPDLVDWLELGVWRCIQLVQASEV